MATNLPQARLPVLNGDNTFSLPWLRFFQGITSGTIDPAIIAALEAEIAALEAAATAAQATANEALIIAEEAEAGISPAYGISFAALDEPWRTVNSSAPMAIMLGMDGEPGADGIGIPGAAGSNGTIGRDGAAGIGIPGMDGADGESGYIVLASTDGGGSSSLTVTDGTHTVSGTTQVTFSGATVGGTTPNATVTVSGGGGVLRGSTFGSSAGSSITIGLPTGSAVGDLAIILSSSAWQFSFLSTAGWATIVNTNVSNWNGTAFAKVLTASDITAGSVTITFTGSFQCYAALITFSTWHSIAAISWAAPGVGGGTSIPVFMVGNIGSGGYGVYYGSERGVGSNGSVDHGALLQSGTNANGSAMLYGGSVASATATFTYPSSAPYYQIAFIVL